MTEPGFYILLQHWTDARVVVVYTRLVAVASATSECGTISPYPEFDGEYVRHSRRQRPGFFLSCAGGEFVTELCISISTMSFEQDWKH
jgi:hypothetical protein